MGMETKTVIDQKEVTHHYFSCDDCGTHLGKSVEFDDGYYEHKGEFHHSIFVHQDNSHYVKDATLCIICKRKHYNKLIDALSSLGYVKE